MDKNFNRLLVIFSILLITIGFYCGFKRTLEPIRDYDNPIMWALII